VKTRLANPPLAECVRVYDFVARMKIRAFLGLFLGLLILSTSTIVAQGPRPQGLTALAKEAPASAVNRASAGDTTMRHNEWKKGALIGIGVGIAGAVIGGLLTRGSVCAPQCGFHVSWPDFLATFGALAIIGGLIGSTVHHE
jgi:hypothetical protein